MAGWNRRQFIGAAGAAAAVAPFSSKGSGGRERATIKVRPETSHTIPREIYGHFIEHLGKCIKGGLWAEGETEDMFLGGVRNELIEAMRSINPPLIRYPGGCFADGYHWKDGIGPREKRATRWNRAWGKLGTLVGPVEDNHFGTDEFMAVCEAVGAEPMLTVNVGSGTAAEAADWVEYVNGPKSSKWGGERAKNGHPEPYKVRYWFVGNEIFGWHEIGNMTPSEYVPVFLDYAHEMKARDPDIKLIAVGQGTEENRTVLKGLGTEVDYLSIHQYKPVANSKNTWRYMIGQAHKTGSEKVYYDVMGSLAEMESFLEDRCKDVRSFSPDGHKVPIAFDEWNLWFNFYGDIIKANYNLRKANYNLRDGLWTASMLNMLHRKAKDIHIANVAQMVNCLGIIGSNEKSTFLTPSALAFKLYTEQAGSELLQYQTDCPPIPHRSGYPLLDASVTRERGRVTVMAANLSMDSDVELACELEGVAVTGRINRTEMHHPDPVRYNTHDSPREVKLVEVDPAVEVENRGSGTVLRALLKPHSLTSLMMEIRSS